MADSRIARSEGLGASSPAPAVTRAAAVLEALAESPSGRLTLSDLSRELRIPKSSTSNLLLALNREGLGTLLAGWLDGDAWINAPLDRSLPPPPSVPPVPLTPAPA